MIVNQFNTFPYGGAATAATRLHHQLRSRSVESRFFYHRNEKSLPDAPGFQQLEFDPPKRSWLYKLGPHQRDKKRKREIHRQFNRHLADHESSGEVFAMAELPDQTRLDWNRHAADVIHLHWISFFADYPSFFGSVPESVPVVWTLHDMNPLTGGCHYSGGCLRFETGCGSCPQIRDPAPGDLSSHTFRIKQDALKNRLLHIVTPSQWLQDLARKSPVFPEGTTFEVIRLGFDLDTFQPVDKQTARRKLGIETDACLIGFGAEDIRNTRKGLGQLLAALPHVDSGTPIECLVFGGGEIPNNIDGLPAVHHQGFVDSPERQALIYSAADVVVVPSREDNQPQVGLEAMACGTPVVGFDAGGIPEYVRDGETGLLAPVGDKSELARRICAMVDAPSVRTTMGAAARQMMEREFDLVQQTDCYIRLYKRIANQPNGTSLRKSA